ncbi:MAG: cytochrome c family protein [Saprospiraceae bacterium]|nr:cytochrome c family protein [Saprospiraceae bacterium]MCF8251547.1 cytochrome c family protein [Saprospiraceae bacterium]MCF8280877.1 cytochrome c family protein [Bacteroidales bacterium]MCF8310943.1 cytochrome c family protein [Saprospiraceae bacterium]MCF8439721.1 cytochrome c family protein [Saprospiraceae bacterium]
MKQSNKATRGIKRNHVIIGVLAAIGFSIAFYTCNIGFDKKEAAKNEITPLTKHWEKAIPHQEIPVGLTSISAESCGACHQEIYQEWKQSTHAVAFQDLQFQAEWKKDDILTCLNCHTPLQNQQEFIVKGLINGDYKTPLKEPNPRFDKKLQLESITCATCHVRGGNVIGTIGTINAPHKTVKDPEFLSEKLCVSCHNVIDELNPVLVCTFETGDEWENNWAKKSGKTCISCHMPEIERPVSTGMKKQLSHFHNFPGSGIPKFFDTEAKKLESLEIEESSIKEMYLVGETIDYVLKLKNSFAGHSVPTGDPERFFVITFRLMDGHGKMIKEVEHRIGEEWQWYPVAKKLSDNNLKPLEERVYNFKYDIKKQGMLTFTVEIAKHRMTEENAKYNGILGKYPLSIEVFKKQYCIKTE